MQLWVDNIKILTPINFYMYHTQSRQKVGFGVELELGLEFGLLL
jgi:hypothetical protein